MWKAVAPWENSWVPRAKVDPPTQREGVGARRLAHPKRAALAVLVVSVVGAAVGFGLSTGSGSGESSVAAEHQRALNEVVSGPERLSPGATAFVMGPHGVWNGAAGTAQVGSGEAMSPDARMRLESVSKIYTATVILRLAQDGKLRVTDTVARWLPKLLPYGDRITLRDLLTMRSGLVNDHDFANPWVWRAGLARVKDDKERALFESTYARVARDRTTFVSPMLWIKFAAWQPLLFSPGSEYHYSNIGYDLLGYVAERAGHASLASLYQRLIFSPLRLTSTAYDPQGPIRGPHAHGYGVGQNGAMTDTTTWHGGIGAGGGIVSDAADTARFLIELMRGRILDDRAVAAMRGMNLWRGGDETGCAGPAFGWSGAGSGYKTNVWVSADGRRVAVLLLNARQLGDRESAGDQAAGRAMAALYCQA